MLRSRSHTLKNCSSGAGAGVMLIFQLLRSPDQNVKVLSECQHTIWSSNSVGLISMQIITKQIGQLLDSKTEKVFSKPPSPQFVFTNLLY